MVSGWTYLLSNGGLRSLVATAAVLGEAQRPRLALIHIHDGRPGSQARLDHVHRQAEHFSVRQVIELSLPRRELAPAGLRQDEAAASLMLRPRVVLTAVAHVMQAGGHRLVWPVQFNGDYATIAAVTEQLVLLRHMIELEPPAEGMTGTMPRPAIETPLLDLTDRQLVELGGQLGVPWHLAWSCRFQGDKPCRVCPGCRRRHSAFHAAGIVDPVEQLV